MSILKRPYVISVWEDVWDTDKFVEKRLGIIGTDEMTAQCRAIEPNLVKNVNGTKKFSFQMYKYYVDNVTGEKTKNPFIDWLISERKVKLFYDNVWYDFIIKDISENSSNYLYSYQLEDAIVQELSKNGFEVELSTEQENNMGTAAELANSVMDGTGWTAESELLVEKIEEALVYVKIPAGTTIQKVTEGESALSYASQALSADTEVLAFYSCCTEKPYRFQFILLDNYSKDKVSVDENRVINVKDCCYYYDVGGENNYVDNDDYGFSLPEDWIVVDKASEGDVSNSKDTTISTWYRGKRYGFTQAAKYVAVVDKYCQEFTKGTGENKKEYYGYAETEYTSPVQIQNIITNHDFKGTSGWIGTAISGGTTDKIKVEDVYGYFNGSSFVSAVDIIKSSSLTSLENCEPYLKIEVSNPSNGRLINTCFYDNRTAIGFIGPGEQWKLNLEFANDDGACTPELCVANYDTDTGLYTIGNPVATYNNGVFTFGDGYSESELKNTKLCLVLSFRVMRTYYLKKTELYKKVGNLQPGVLNGEGVVTTNWHFFLKSYVDDKTPKDEIVFDTKDKNVIGVDYIPKFVSNAEKVRSITAKESNYFNILQSIAETFEAWLSLEITRDESGGISTKEIKFKKYAGGENYAAFRYGVNLKDIQRTHTSKNIVTKLIVKQNSNQYANNGFCTIARANSNPTGESCIYDFQYYHNTGLLRAEDYIDVVYSTKDQAGPDLGNSETYNLKGYFPRIKSLNRKMQKENEKIVGLTTDLVKLRAEKVVEEGLVSTATDGIERVSADFMQLTGNTITSPGTCEEGSKAYSLLKEYAEYLRQKTTSAAKLGVEVNKDNYGKITGDARNKIYYQIYKKEQELTEHQTSFQAHKGHKLALNGLFYQRYSRFIQEGTWISEEYTDDEKYYIDAQSVMYNSCYPQVAYTINVLELSRLPGYELFKFNLGDKTYAEDPEFFDRDGREEVIVAEISENLDDPTKNTIKVQNFKNQFQDLFQKITATVQQTQYSTGAYQKAVALAEADAAAKGEFLGEALSNGSAKLSAAGQTTVVQDVNGITLTDENTKDQMRLIGGAILMSQQDEETGERTWKTGLTPEGISASLITAGTINAGNVAIMNGSEPAFRWDAYGLSAFDDNADGTYDENKFVRFDKYGIYGIDGKDGTAWKADSLDGAVSDSNFALTWEGLKVTGANNVTALIGKKDNNIIKITKKNNEQATEDIFAVNDNGDLRLGGNIQLGGNITWGASSSPTQVLYNASGAAQKPSGLYKNFVDGTGGWYKTIGDRKYASYTYDGGSTWGEVIQIVGAQGPEGPKGDRGDAGTGVSVKENESACVAIGDGYIDADGNLMILTSTTPREFTNGGQIKGPKGDTTYFHTAYANSSDGKIDFSVNDYANKEFIGHYTDTIEADSTDPSKYKWTKTKGEQGEPGEPGLVAKSVFNDRYETNSTGSVETKIFNRTPKVGEIFTNLCANTYYTTFEVIAVNGNTVSIKSVNEISYTTRDGIVDALNMLSSENEDGIYQTGDGKIGINASAIKTGCIAFGDNGGWYIDPFNAKGAGKYLNLPGLSITGSAAEFSGTVYAKAGEIGGLQIGEIASTSSVDEARTYADGRAAAAQSAAETNAAKDAAEKANAAEANAKADATKKASAAETNAVTTAKGYTNSSLKNYAPLVSDEEDFSWKLSPSEGFYMYNGSGNKKEDVFKIYKPENEENYEAWLKGHVEAESGDIGGWKITEDAIECYDENRGTSIGLYSGTETYNSLASTGTSPIRLKCAGGNRLLSPVTKVRSFGREVSMNSTSTKATLNFPEEVAGVEEMSIKVTYPTTGEYSADIDSYEISGKNIAIALSYTKGTQAVEITCTYRTYTSSSFMMLEDGSLYTSSLQIANGVIGTDNSVIFSTTNVAGVLGFFDGTKTNNWKIAIGKNLGITGEGYLYAKNANIEITSGKIGAFKIVKKDDKLDPRFYDGLVPSSYDKTSSVISPRLISQLYQDSQYQRGSVSRGVCFSNGQLCILSNNKIKIPGLDMDHPVLGYFNFSGTMYDKNGEFQYLLYYDIIEQTVKGINITGSNQFTYGSDRDGDSKPDGELSVKPDYFSWPTDGFKNPYHIGGA